MYFSIHSLWPQQRIVAYSIGNFNTLIANQDVLSNEDFLIMCHMCNTFVKDVNEICELLKA